MRKEVPKSKMKMARKIPIIEKKELQKYLNEEIKIDSFMSCMVAL
jgi:hypothetical protein